MDHDLFPVICRVPALPVKNLTGSGPVHPALAGTAQHLVHFSVNHFIGMTETTFITFTA